LRTSVVALGISLSALIHSTPAADSSDRVFGRWEAISEAFSGSNIRIAASTIDFRDCHGMTYVVLDDRDGRGIPEFPERLPGARNQTGWRTTVIELRPKTPKAPGCGPEVPSVIVMSVSQQFPCHADVMLYDAKQRYLKRSAVFSSGMWVNQDCLARKK